MGLKADVARTWVVVRIMVPFWNKTRHLIFRGPKRGPSFSQPATYMPGFCKHFLSQSCGRDIGREYEADIWDLSPVLEARHGPQFRKLSASAARGRLSLPTRCLSSAARRSPALWPASCRCRRYRAPLRMTTALHNGSGRLLFFSIRLRRVRVHAKATKPTGGGPSGGETASLIFQAETAGYYSILALPSRVRLEESLNF